MSSLISHLDHLVLTTRFPSKCIDFYTRVLGMQLERFGSAGRIALKYGTSQKINVHEYGHEFEPKALLPTPGSLDLCFIAAQPLETILVRLRELEIDVEEGPVPRTGAQYPIMSVYVRDPDGNLIEIAERRQAT